ncbi:hypothetical protein, partial [Ruminococcus sp.]|uniref:hypothetical protein n=1 Tax=Ruminococcus sp. TaxID=41978 RepID=UPI002E7FEA56
DSNNNFVSNGISDASGAEEIILPGGITSTSEVTDSSTAGAKVIGEYPVLIIGSLSNNPAIDSATNFYFAGATITFTEAASN